MLLAFAGWVLLGPDPFGVLWSRKLGLLLLLAGLTLRAGGGILILRGYHRDIRTLVDLTHGSYEQGPGRPLPRGELGHVALALAQMQAMDRSHDAELRETLARLRDANRSIGQREAFFRALVQAAPVAIVTLDPDWTITGLNPHAERMLGYRAEELIGKATPAIWADTEDHSHFIAQVSEEVGHPVAPGRSFFEALDPAHPLAPRERQWVRKDGTRVPVMLGVTAIQGPDGSKLGVLGVATDLTVLKTLEGELREREAEARAANQAKSVFLATMSHEVRTPLIGVLGMLELLSLTQLDPEQRRSVNVIYQSAQNLMQILGGILDFTRIEAGRLDLAPAPMSLRRLMEELAFVFSRAAASKGLQFSSAVAGEVAPAHLADGLRLRQVLTNLLSNAVKFTSEGGVEFSLEAEASGQAAQSLVFRIRDTGVGVSSEQRERLFQPFAQVESTTTRRFGGTGLGLAICRRIAEAMDGSLSMDSALGQGTTVRFALTLPLADPAAIPARDSGSWQPPELEARAAPSVEEAQREGTLILLAEDHPTNRLVLQHQIRRAGYASETAVDGEQALGRWASGRYGLILTDVHMPGLDGYDLTAVIRELEVTQGRPRTPILAITANVLQGEAERCLDAGMDDYLSKPVTIPDLALKLAQWLPRPAAPPPGGPVPEAAPVVNMDLLLDLAGGETSAALGVLQDFLQSAREDMEALAKGAEGRDAALATRHAHRLKGAAAMVGALPLAK
ncbi:MAG TPA: ATP-binding protein, partial [Holophagaceae bacterium]|nr:ATP-binding protein [Holophagaceae bacterium]